MSEQEMLLDQAKMLISRLERISVDSIWSHRSSGHRGAMLKIVERADLLSAGSISTLTREDWIALDRLLKIGCEMLEKEAQERLS